MFKNWGFLLSEMWLLILLAALLGLVAGWLIFGRRDLSAYVSRTDLDDCRRANADKDKRIAELVAEKGVESDRARELQAQLRAQGDHASDAAQIEDLRAQLRVCQGQHEYKDEEIARLKAEAAQQAEGSVAAPVVPAAPPEPAPDAAAAQGEDYDGDGIVEGRDEGQKPETLAAARAGGADDLKQIKGIGPKLEQLCNRLGFFHFDQIASWSSDEVAWVDANLEGFKGRVSRDAWVEQAKVLAAGGATEFSKRVEDGDVY